MPGGAARGRTKTIAAIDQTRNDPRQLASNLHPPGSSGRGSGLPVLSKGEMSEARVSQPEPARAPKPHRSKVIEIGVEGDRNWCPTRVPTRVHWCQQLALGGAGMQCQPAVGPCWQQLAAAAGHRRRSGIAASAVHSHNPQPVFPPPRQRGQPSSMAHYA